MGREVTIHLEKARECAILAVEVYKGEDPRKTNPKFCQYDEAHKDYVYTEEWKNFLMKEMAKPGQYARIFSRKNDQQTAEENGRGERPLKVKQILRRTTR